MPQGAGGGDAETIEAVYGVPVTVERYNVTVSWFPWNPATVAERWVYRSVIARPQTPGWCRRIPPVPAACSILSGSVVGILQAWLVQT